MRSSNSKMIGNGITNTTGTPVENGLPQKESLPTIQIDTVPSPLSSPTELSPVSVQTSEEEPIDTSQIDIELDEEQTPECLSDELRDSLKDYIEELLSKAMVVAEKKLEFEDGDSEVIKEPEVEKTVVQATPISEVENKQSDDPDDAAIRAAAEKVVEEVLSKAQETVVEQIEQFEKEVASLNFPITFEEAPECVKDVASNFVKEIVSKAIAQAEEKAVPSVPFNFVAEDPDLIKANGPWYVRVREAFIRVLRTACFCTPRRNDS